MIQLATLSISSPPSQRGEAICSQTTPSLTQGIHQDEMDED